MTVKRVISNGNGSAGETATLPMAGTRMNLASIGKSVSLAAEKIVLYAPEGWGKTTWAAKSEAPIFISTEGGLKAVNVDAFPEPQTWQEVFDAVETLRREDHRFKTLVVDTADWTEHLTQQFIIQQRGVKSIEDIGGGFGKGYVAVAEEWRKLLSPIEALRRDKGMNIIFLAHSQVRPFNNPSGDNYDRWEMKTDKRISGMLKEWADAVLFGAYDVAVAKEGISRGKGFGGERIIRVNHAPAWDAKNRYGIEAPLTADFAEFWKYAKGGTNENKPAV